MLGFCCCGSARAGDVIVPRRAMCESVDTTTTFLQTQNNNQEDERRPPRRTSGLRSRGPRKQRHININPSSNNNQLKATSSATSATLSLINYLPLGKWNKTEIIECSICMEEFMNEDDIRYLPCLHVFHSNCVDRWLERSFTCPICLLDITDSLPVESVIAYRQMKEQNEILSRSQPRLWFETGPSSFPPSSSSTPLLDPEYAKASG